METSRATATISDRHLEPSQRVSDQAIRNDDKLAHHSACLQSSSESASKTKPASCNCDNAKSKKSKETTKSETFGGRRRAAKNSKANYSKKMRAISFSDLEKHSSSEGDGSSCIETDDEAKEYGKRRSIRARRSRCMFRHHVHDIHDTLAGPHGAVCGTDDGMPPSRREASSLKDGDPDKRSGVGKQEDISQALAQLELRCGLLQQQLDCMTGCQTTHINRAFLLQQRPVLSNIYNPCSTADLAQIAYSGIAQTSQNGLNTSAPARQAHESSTQLVNSGPDGGSRDCSCQNRKLEKSESRHGTGESEAKFDFKRVDEVWDHKLCTFRHQTTSEEKADVKYQGYLFHVRRTFESDGRYRATSVDIKSQLLRGCLQDVIGNVRGMNLIDELPKIEPNLLFLYLEDLRSHVGKLREAEPAGTSRHEQRQGRHLLDKKRKELEVLIKYLDNDYEKVKKSLYPMLRNGIISFEYLWALWKPNTLVYCGTYGETEHPRVFKLDMAVRHVTVFQNVRYFLEGKYLDFDGKRFGFGNMAEEVVEFHGTRKIISLPCYPLSYHKDKLKLRQTLIERGKKFVSLSGSHLKEYSGTAYMRQKIDAVSNVHIQTSRIMVDPAMFRRVNPNNFASAVRPKDFDALSTSGPKIGGDVLRFLSNGARRGTGNPKLVSKAMKGSDGGAVDTDDVQDDVDASSNSSPFSFLSQCSLTGTNDTDSSTAEKVVETHAEEAMADQCLGFTDEDYLLASPLVLGFSFSHKLWLEFLVSKLGEVRWNEDAWASLVVPPETKDVIQALVKSRKNNKAQTTDDFIQGKGKGLVTVLHGPPGTGKTLTAEGISELLRCPLYVASAGELGSTARQLESDLQKAIHICHCWGAILLLDEADVFLEKRNMHDLNRNALVSVFLRQLEYFQGILFLTTNRVETFDDAFQSRIHVALRYEGLDSKAKKTIFKMFIDRVEAHGQLAVERFRDEDLNRLAKHDVNGREIKNLIASAQDLALTKAEALSMKHVQQVLDIHLKFGRDLKGGTGYEDAMRSYC